MSFIRKNYSKPEQAICGLIVLYLIVGYVVLTKIGKPEYFSISMYTVLTASFLLPVTMIYIGFRWVYIMIRIRPDALFLYFYKDLCTLLFTRVLWLNKIVLFILMLMFHSVFTGIKASMPFIADYQWDQEFASLDRWIHFGFDPATMLSGFWNVPEATFFLSILYFVWFFVLFGFLQWKIFDLRFPKLRSQFLLSFVITWIVLGNVLAVIFASGGPCFFHFFEPTMTPNPFSEHMAYLASVNEIYPIWAVSTQATLLEQFQAAELSLGAGISAMPSLHVALATLVVPVAWRTHKAFGTAMLLYLVLILIGSVHLGWHYAVDGYVSILLTVIIWKLVGAWLAYAERAESMVAAKELTQS